MSDLNGDGLPDVVVGAPNAAPPGCLGVGVTYVYLAQGSLATGTTGWTRYRIDPPSLDGDGAQLFGWCDGERARQPPAVRGRARARCRHRRGGRTGLRLQSPLAVMAVLGY